ncbi:DUF1508 domain protein (plasmid) [Natrialba magadii ATCC 43099]|uniref:DUF1508 domain protein n=1 Tax=Natrialba magadii (strain ATCC 43099 / DSM 3394 / CCM 3739 / CIP 104546 / IAM 13178 / JCM 8861 / NBRC 102185 / NCIMB 2190 / MS3) TaxID=547559 RepID=D3T230_NATMM|nr:DUF1508 domain-containing protein [Natrialba magadii]ADD07639.1 DUF1508 domain protein [Natrialba magadii ATCC 43099]ELY27119.1 hypothetical protein C500_14815 [Natrialba magadii ATCC 43099]
MSLVRKRGFRTGGGGLGLLLIGISADASAPAWWPAQSPDLQSGVLATALLLIVGLVALGITAGSKYRTDDELEPSAAPVLPSGDDSPRTELAVRQDETGGWQWHVVQISPLATGDVGADTQSAATTRTEQLQTAIETAGVTELPRAMVRVTESRDGEWRWSLVRADGTAVSTSNQLFEDRDAALSAVSQLQEHGSTADLVEVEGAAITYSEEPDGWHWRLVDDERTVLATSERGFTSQDEAADAARTFAERVTEAPLLDIETAGVELYDREDGWAWRIVDESDEIIADAAATFETRRAAEAAAESVLPAFDSAAITVAGEPTYEHYRDESGWRWRLVDATDRVLARAPDGYSEPERTDRMTETFSAAVPDADVVAVDDAIYECYPGAESENWSRTGSGGDTEAIDGEDAGAETQPDATTDAWHWRLVTADREAIAASTVPYTDAAAAADAIERIREQAREAELIEFETAAFQVYEAGDGTWRWRLLDEDGSVLADSNTDHASRSEAAEAMLTLKEQAPDADVLEIETAAFELFGTEDAEWGWRLIDRTGTCLAAGTTTYPTRDDARRAMERLLEHVTADVQTMDQPAFQLSASHDWRWRLVHPTGDTIAVGDDPFPTRDALADELETVRETAAAAQDVTLGEVTVQLYDSGDWHWRLLDRDREVLAASTVSYPEREAAVGAVETLQQGIADARVFTIDDAALRLDDADGWRWELITRERDVRAHSSEVVDTRADLVAALENVRRLAPLADSIGIGEPSFDLVETESGRWRWRLLAADGTPVASGANTHESDSAARDTLSAVQELLDEATVREHDNVTFELCATADGWGWQLVDADGEILLESTQPYATRAGVREALTELKAQVVDSEFPVAE